MTKKSQNHEPYRERPMLMTAKEMAKICGIGENTLRRLMDERQIEYLQVGSHRLLTEAAIMDYYRRSKTPAQIKDLSTIQVIERPSA